MWIVKVSAKNIVISKKLLKKVLHCLCNDGIFISVVTNELQTNNKLLKGLKKVLDS